MQQDLRFYPFEPVPCLRFTMAKSSFKEFSTIKACDMSINEFNVKRDATHRPSKRDTTQLFDYIPEGVNGHS